ncbi:MAG: hypothetical protein H6907_11440 [Hyphomicrobiales bacterium]|nr:hypothetical protein [Hyphomicrobiales bacterium]MCP5372335.1 hypothetical protein [Hyphomicrobiales bacterium]
MTGADGQAGAGAARALVFFVDQTDLWWLRFLRPGFRHCFAIVGGGMEWILLNPLSNRMELAMFRGVRAEDFRRVFHRARCRSLECPLFDPPPRPAPWRPFTCVEAVKRVLGLRAPGVLTPWQLYRYLKKIIITEKNT